MKDVKPSIKPLLEAAYDYLQQSDVSRALFCFENALEWEVPDLRLWKGMADCYYILGDFDRAVQFWDRALELDPYDQETQQNLAMYWSPSFQSWLKRIREAVKSVELKEYDRARDQLKNLLEEKDGIISLYQILGLSHMACSDLASARRVWKRGLQFDSSNAMLIKYLQSLDRLQRPQPAGVSRRTRKVIKKPWIKVGTGAAALLTCMAIFTAVQQGDTRKNDFSAEVQEAKLAQATALQFNERNVNSSPEVHSSFREDGSSSEDLKKQELQQYTAGFRAYLNGDWGQARNGFGSVVAWASGSYINRESLYYLARICYLSNKYDEAEKYFKQYLGQFPESNYYDESLYYLACIYHRTGRDDRARETFNELYRLVPDSGYLTSSDCIATGLN